jgi:hypothetical protein
VILKNSVTKTCNGEDDTKAEQPDETQKKVKLKACSSEDDTKAEVWAKCFLACRTLAMVSFSGKGGVGRASEDDCD